MGQPCAVSATPVCHAYAKTTKIMSSSPSLFSPIIHFTPTTSPPKQEKSRDLRTTSDDGDFAIQSEQVLKVLDLCHFSRQKMLFFFSLLQEFEPVSEWCFLLSRPASEQRLQSHLDLARCISKYMAMAACLTRVLEISVAAVSKRKNPTASGSAVEPDVQNKIRDSLSLS